MKQLNYNHLYYFYIVAKEGSIIAASKILHLTPQTISGQIGTLEDYLDTPLFERYGKRLVLNDKGNMVFSYAEDIFNLGHELLQNIEPSHEGQKMPFNVGITDVIPKVFSYDLLKHVLDDDLAVKLICREGELDQLLGLLALNKLDVILSDCPIPPGTQVKAFSYKILDSGLSFYIAKDQQDKLKGDFPTCLNKQDMLIPGEQSSIRLSLLSWLNDRQLRPNIVAEFDDSALAKLFGKAGYGIFCTPSIVEQHVLDNYDVAVIGRTTDVTESLYLICAERKFKHPAMVALEPKLQLVK